MSSALPSRDDIFEQADDFCFRPRLLKRSEAASAYHNHRVASDASRDTGYTCEQIL